MKRNKVAKLKGKWFVIGHTGERWWMKISDPFSSEKKALAHLRIQERVDRHAHTLTNV